MLLLALLLEGEQLGRIEWDVAAALAVLYSGPLATAFAFWASQMIVQALGPLTAGIGYLGAPAVGVIAGIIVLGEVVTVLDVAGVLVTTAGIVVVLLAARPGTSRSRPAVEAGGVDPSRDAASSPEVAATLEASTRPPAGRGQG
jgi:drug/metabolite transporter (DMT)-like permease